MVIVKCWGSVPLPHCLHTYLPLQELLLVMNSHQNMQRIVDTAWSFYLLK